MEIVAMILAAIVILNLILGCKSRSKSSSYARKTLAKGKPSPKTAKSLSTCREPEANTALSMDEQKEQPTPLVSEDTQLKDEPVAKQSTEEAAKLKTADDGKKKRRKSEEGGARKLTKKEKKTKGTQESPPKQAAGKKGLKPPKQAKTKRTVEGPTQEVDLKEDGGLQPAGRKKSAAGVPPAPHVGT
ncbi:hypothetical protein COOONC_10259 [Cooperia oncophora]